MDPPPRQGRRDRLPLIILPVIFVALAAVGVASVYALSRVEWTFGDTESSGGSATVADDTTSPGQETHRVVTYAGITRERAKEFAATDFVALLSDSSGADSEIGVIVTTGSTFRRTRCFHAGRWRPYWRVILLGGSSVFESRRDGLFVCNRNSQVTELSPTIEHSRA